MGVTSWTSLGTTSYVSMTSPTALTVTGSSVAITMPTTSVKMNMGGASGVNFKYQFGVDVEFGGTKLFSKNGSTTAWTANNVYASLTWAATTSQNTSVFFNSNNPTTKTVSISLTSNPAVLSYSDNYGGAGSYYGSSKVTYGTINLTLNVPPTATVSAISYDTGFVYAGLTTASVTVSNATAYYGGSITDVTFRIGAQSASISGNGTLSIALDTAGTFTPTVTITDSRGQTYTETLAEITVNSYTAPSVSFSADRTLQSGKPDDEGTYATLDTTFTFADVIATAIAPSVVMTDENGTQTTPTVTWYSSRAADGTLSGSVTWASLSSGDMVYGLVPGLNTQYSYTISVRPRDSQGTGTAITQTISSAFYTIDFLAGGHGIAFGKPASATGFGCAMAAAFENTVDVDGALSCNNDVLIDLPNYQTSGTTDYDIYTAIGALGWDSEVIV